MMFRLVALNPISPGLNVRTTKSIVLNHVHAMTDGQRIRLTLYDGVLWLR